MKKVMILAVASFLVLTSFKGILKMSDNSGTKAAQQLAESLVVSLQQTSEQKYLELFPSLAEFHQIMKENQSVYGSNLEAARKEFDREYGQKLLPAARESFNTLITEGKKKGIEWSKVQLVNIEAGEANGPVWTGTITLVITEEGKEHRIAVDKALYINGRWKVSQFTKLI